jgi:hypothetical protein
MNEANLDGILPEFAAVPIIMGAVESQSCQIAHGMAVATARHWVFSNAILLSVL